jgi:HTH domain
MEKLGCSRATLHRDIALLKDYLHAPVEFDADGGGYKFSTASGTYELPGLWFSAAELQALVFFNDWRRIQVVVTALPHLKCYRTALTASSELLPADRGTIAPTIRGRACDGDRDDTWIEGGTGTDATEEISRSDSQTEADHPERVYRGHQISPEIHHPNTQHIGYGEVAKDSASQAGLR